VHFVAGSSVQHDRREEEPWSGGPTVLPSPCKERKPKPWGTSPSNNHGLVSWNGTNSNYWVRWQFLCVRCGNVQTNSALSAFPSHVLQLCTAVPIPVRNT